MLFLSESIQRQLLNLINRNVMRLLSYIFGTLVTIGHIWTTIVAFKESGIIAAVLSLVLPVLSEIYWVVKLFGINNHYVIYIILCAVVFLPLSRFLGRTR